MFSFCHGNISAVSFLNDMSMRAYSSDESDTQGVQAPNARPVKDEHSVESYHGEDFEFVDHDRSIFGDDTIIELEPSSTKKSMLLSRMACSRKAIAGTPAAANVSTSFTLR